MVGADEENYYFNDPYDGHGVIGYPKALVEDRHQAQHMQAVAVVKILENDCERESREQRHSEVQSVDLFPAFCQVYDKKIYCRF